MLQRSAATARPLPRLAAVAGSRSQASRVNGSARRNISGQRSSAALPTLATRVNTAENFHSRVRGFATEAGPSTSLSRKPHFDKILIANRGEIACRVIRTAKKLGIKTVAVYSEVDADSLHVKMADEAYCIGPASSAESYLRMDKILHVCKLSGAQAVHPGYGFLSENAKFSELLANEGIVFIGPPASAIVSMGSKSESKNIMSNAGVPVVPGYHGTNQDPNFLLEQAKEIGFPVLIKAVHGGGGKGMRTVFAESEFTDALLSAQRESVKSFGSPDVLVEKFIVRPRHVEVQVFADTHGSCVGLWERDCSVQRRNQKIIEEAPAPGLSEEMRAELCKKAVDAALAVSYVGAGTVEFIFDNDTEKFFFMEMNTRLQVEHPVTEMITGLDLVEWQLEVAAGNPLPLSQKAIPLVGHAFEARIYAENPRNEFLPDSGTLAYLSTPEPNCVFAPALPAVEASGSNPLARSVDTTTAIAPSLRLEQGFFQNSQIGVFYDPMIAKLIVHGRDRTEALRVLRKALEEYRVVGVSTNVEFLRSLAGHQSFIQGDVETGFIKKHYKELFPPLPEPSPEVLAQAALYVVLRDQPTPAVSTANISPWASLPSRRFGGDLYERIITFQTEGAPASSGEPAESQVNTFAVHVKSLPSGTFDISIRDAAGQEVKSFNSVSGQLASKTALSTTLDNAAVRSTIVSQPPPPALPASNSPNTMERLHIFSNSGAGALKTTLVLPTPTWLRSLGSEVLGAAKGSLKAPMPSVVVEVRVNVGDVVKKGDPVVVLESMKTETVLRAPVAGTVKSIGCAMGEMVPEGKELVEVEEDTE